MSGDDTTEFEGDRISKVMARAGVCSRRDAERWIADGRVAINGVTLDSPAVNVAEGDVVTVDGEPLASPDEARLWRFHKPDGLVTTHKDPQGRPTVFDQLPRDLPRVVSVGRLDLNSEGLLLLTNDGELAGKLEHPSTGWTRRYRVRVNGVVDPARLASVADGVTVEGVNYGPVRIEIERQQATNAWLAVSLTEGKNREIRRVMDHLGYRVNRLIRVAYGPFSIGRLDKGQIEEVPRKVLRDALAGFGEAVPEELRKPKPETTAKWAKAKPKPTKPGQKKHRDGPVAAAARDGKPWEARGDKPFRKREEGDKPFRKRDDGGKPFQKRDGDDKPFRKPREDGPRSDRPRDDRPRGDRPQGDRPRSDRPREDRPRGERQWEDRPRGDRPRDDRPRDDRPRSDRPRDDRPRGERQWEDRPRGDRPRDDRPRDDRPRSDRPREDRPRGDRQWEDRPPREDRPRGPTRPDGTPLPPAKPGANKKRARKDGLPGPRPLKSPGVKRKD